MLLVNAKEKLQKYFYILQKNHACMTFGSEVHIFRIDECTEKIINEGAKQMGLRNPLNLFSSSRNEELKVKKRIISKKTLNTLNML